jgi:hypothetical protein
MLNAKIFAPAILLSSICILQLAHAENRPQETSPAAVPAQSNVKNKQNAADLLGTSAANLRTTQSEQVKTPQPVGIAIRQSDVDFVRLEPALNPSDFLRVDEDPGLKIQLESIDKRRQSP